MRYSILIPAYKAQFLKECIDSILAQTYKEFELIIVNDASPEDLNFIVNQYNDNRIRYYVNKTNCGAINVVDNWNICLGYALGDYVICMGDDDKLLPNCLEGYNKLMEQYPNLGLYHAWTEIIDENSNVVAMQQPRPLFEGVYSLACGRIIDQRLQYIGDFAFETKRLRDSGGFYKIPLAWGSDCISAYIAAKAAGVANSQEPLFQYRRSSLNITTGGNVHVKIQSIKDNIEWLNEFVSVEPDKKDIVEHTYWLMLKNKLPSLASQWLASEVMFDMMRNGILKKMFYWLIHGRNHRLSIPIIGWAFISAVKWKMMNNTNKA